MHDVHVRKRMSFAGSAGSTCKLIHMWELLGHKPVCTRMKGIGGHVVPFSACRIAVIEPMLLSEPICTEIHASLTPGFPLKIVSSNPKQSDELGRLQCPWQ